MLETVPPVALHVTAVLVVPVTVAKNCCVPPVNRELVVGEMETETGALTVTSAEAVFVESAALFAVMVYVPAVVGAVYRPVLEIVPPVALQLTPVFVVPVTVAENCCVAPVRIEAEVGFTETEIGAETVTVAEADLVLSATLVAVTV